MGGYRIFLTKENSERKKWTHAINKMVDPPKWIFFIIKTSERAGVAEPYIRTCTTCTLFMDDIMRHKYVTIYNIEYIIVIQYRIYSSIHRNHTALVWMGGTIVKSFTNIHSGQSSSKSLCFIEKWICILKFSSRCSFADSHPSFLARSILPRYDNDSHHLCAFPDRQPKSRLTMYIYITYVNRDFRRNIFYWNSLAKGEYLNWINFRKFRISWGLIFANELF